MNEQVPSKELAQYLAHLAGCTRGALKGEESVTMRITLKDSEAIQTAADLLSAAHEPRPDAVEALRPFVELYEKVDERYRKRGGNPDVFKDSHPFSDIPAGDLPMGVWRRAQAAYRAAPPPGDGPESLLHALEVLRQRWSHNANFEATIGACREEIELCIARAEKETGSGQP